MGDHRRSRCSPSPIREPGRAPLRSVWGGREARKNLVEKVVEFTTKEIFIVIEGGVVHEVVNLPPNIHVTIIDYDTEGVEKERLEISPVDGEVCVINKWRGGSNAYG
jgi:hypothetical protein